MNEYSFVTTCNKNYSFGLISCLNAQHHFGTKADWCIGYEDFPEDYRKRISDSFPFDIKWIPLEEIYRDFPHKVTDPVTRYWIGYSLLAHSLLKSQAYKAVCITGADCFFIVNLTPYFKAAAHGVIVCSEYPFNSLHADDLPFGDDKAIWDRSQCALFDGATFLGQMYADLPMDVALYQTQRAVLGEENHPVIALNRAVCKHGQKDMVLGLDGKLWVCDSVWPSTRFSLGLGNKKVYNAAGVRICAWHTRWWQEGRAASEWEHSKALLQRKDNAEYIKSYDNFEHNMNFVKDYMEEFNAMKPAIKSDLYLKGKIERVHHELANV